MKNTLSGKKLVAMLLVVISAVMLFAGWTGIRFGEDTVSKSDWADIMDDSIDELDGYLKEYSEYGESLGISKDGIRSIRSLMKALKDGTFAPSEAGSMAIAAGKAAKAMENMYSYSIAMELIEIFSQVKSGLIIVAVLFWIAILLALYAIYGLYAGKKNAAVPYFIVTAVLMVGFIVATIVANNVMADMYGIDDMPAMFSLRVWPFLTVVLAFLACAVAAVAHTAAPATVGAPAATQPGFVPSAPAANGWTCPNCGAAQADTSSFCMKCGTAKPQDVFCANCGAKLAPGVSFCPNCGTKRE